MGKESQACDGNMGKDDYIQPDSELVANNFHLSRYYIRLIKKG